MAGTQQRRGLKLIPVQGYQAGMGLKLDTCAGVNQYGYFFKMRVQGRVL